MTAPATPPPPPEATLIRLVREAAGLSPETAAARMETKFSGSRWRQIERGWRGDSGPVVAPDITLAQMAFTLGISADRLAETGRDKAVGILREMEQARTPAPAAAPEVKEPLAQLPEWQQQVILNALDEKPRSARDKAALLRMLAEQIEAQSDESSPTDDPSNSKAPGRSA